MSKNNNISLPGLITWIICTLFFMYEFLSRTISGTFQSSLMHDLHLSAMQFAILSTTVYQIIYGFMQIPVGVIVDQMGLKKTLFIALFLCALGNFGFSFSHYYISAILCRMLVGLGSSCGFICLLMAIYDWMPRKNVALFIGISQFIGTLGPMLAAGPLQSLAQNSGINWREIFFYLGMVGIILSILVILYVKNNRQQQNTIIVLSPSISLITSLTKLIQRKQIWLIAIYSASVFFSIEYFTENEGTEFLIKRGFSPEFSSYMMTLAWLGYAIGSPLLGFLSDKMQRRKPFMILCATLTFTTLGVILYAPLNQSILLICFSLLGVGTAGSIIGFAMMAEQCTEHTLAAGIGFNNTMIVLSTALHAPFIGYLLSRFSLGGMLQLVDYQKAFMVVLLLAMVALCVAIFYIKETFCKSTCENTILKSSKLQDFLLEMT